MTARGGALADSVHCDSLFTRPERVRQGPDRRMYRGDSLYFFQRDSKRFSTVFLRTDWAGNTCPLAVM